MSGGVTTEYDEATSWGHFEAVGSFSGNTFVGNYTEFDHTGALTVTLNDKHDLVTGVSWTNIYKDGGVTSNSAVSGFDIPVNDLVRSVFKVEGEQTCNHVSSIEFSSTTASAEVTLEGLKCTSLSSIAVSFREQ